MDIIGTILGYNVQDVTLTSYWMGRNNDSSGFFNNIWESIHSPTRFSGIFQDLYGILCTCTLQVGTYGYI